MRCVKGLAVIATCVALGLTASGAASTSTALTRCRSSQLRLSGGLQGATQSLRGTLTIVNQGNRACALPKAPSRVTLVIGRKVLPALTVPMNARLWPPGKATRRLSAHGRVVVGIQWRNWCGAPRGDVRLSVGLTIYGTETRRASVGRVTTPQCGDRKYSSRVAVSPFIVSR
jgi:hypothetical protein